MLESQSVPTHIGYIVDGNRRWAKKHGLPSYEGHLAGFNILKDVARSSIEQGVKYTSFYVFSTENWNRSKEEVSKLMKYTLKVLTKDVEELIKEKVRVRIAGSRDRVAPEILDAIDSAERRTDHFTRATIIFCFNYGGQREIAEAAQKCVRDGLKADEITEQAIAQRLYLSDVPPVDLVVRTSGEQRLSNFMLWRSAYAELLFLEKFWPEMRDEDVTAIINEYGTRQRRLGK